MSEIKPECVSHLGCDDDSRTKRTHLLRKKEAARIAQRSGSSRSLAPLGRFSGRAAQTALVRLVAPLAHTPRDATRRGGGGRHRNASRCLVLVMRMRMRLRRVGAKGQKKRCVCQDNCSD